MAKMVAAAKTTAWGGKYGSLAIALDKKDYKTTTRYAGAKIDWLVKPALVNEDTTTFSTPFETLTLQEKQKLRKMAYKLQEAATEIGVEKSWSALKNNMWKS